MSYCFVGRAANSASNLVYLSDAGTILSNSQQLVVGSIGSGNQLVVSNGATAFNNSAHVGSAATSSNNLVIVTGPSSVWSNLGPVSVGYAGNANLCRIDDGATVYSPGGQIGDQATGNSNVVIATGPGTLWSNTGTLAVGYGGSSNSMLITNGATVLDDTGHVGSAADSQNNTVVICGATSVWSNRFNLFVGSNGNSSNRLIACEGGVAWAETCQIAGTNNSIDLANGIINSQLEIGQGSTLSGCGTVTGPVVNHGAVNGNSSGGTLSLLKEVENWGILKTSANGTLEFFSPVVNYGLADFTDGVALFHNLALGTANTTNSWIAMAGGAWQDAANWSIGVPSPSQQSILITNSFSKVITIDSTTALAAGDSLTNLLVTVSGDGQSTNTLRITDIGHEPSFLAVNLTVGTGGRLEMTNSSLSVGLSSVNRGFFHVAGQVFLTDGMIRADAASTVVGIVGAAGRIVIADGGALITTNACLGDQAGSDGNVVDVHGVSSVLSNLDTVCIGYSGSVNQVSIQNGGAVLTDSGVLGYHATSLSNVLEVSGAGSTWDCGTLTVGLFGSANELILTNGGQLVEGFGYVGYDQGASNNLVVVSDLNSVWNNSTNLFVGFASANNQIRIADGGLVASGSGFVGYGVGAYSNRAEVCGTAARWCNTKNLYVGHSGPWNTLIITNGGAVYNNNAYLGYNGAFGNSNLVMVSGIGSAWHSAGFLTVGGYLCRGNQLIITDGGLVACDSALINQGYGAVSNRIEVAGGSLYATNALAGGMLFVKGWGLTIDAGTITTDFMNAYGVTFRGGTVLSRNTYMINSHAFSIGDGVHGACYRLLGGDHMFGVGIRVRNSGSLTGCGRLAGDIVVDPGALVLIDCGSLTTFANSVTNNGLIKVINGAGLQVNGVFVNNGTIDSINGVTSFQGEFINNGTLLDAATVVVNQTAILGNDVIVEVPSTVGHTYQLQGTGSLRNPTWTDVGVSQPGTGNTLILIDPAGLTNTPARYYRIQVTSP